MHGWKLSRCVYVNQLLIERAISHLCPRVEVSNFSRSTLNEKLVFSRLIKVASLTIFCVPLRSYNFIFFNQRRLLLRVFCSERRKMTDQWNRQIKRDLS